MKLTVYTDGASRGNPGESSYGFVITNEHGDKVYEEGKYIGIATNNIAEYSAVLSAFEYIEKNLFSKSLSLNFFMDSRLVAEQLSGRFKIKSENLKPLVAKIKKLEEKFKVVTYTHVPREKNKNADFLANLALDSR